MRTTIRLAGRTVCKFMHKPRRENLGLSLSEAEGADFSDGALNRYSSRVLFRNFKFTQKPMIRLGCVGPGCQQPGGLPYSHVHIKRAQAARETHTLSFQKGLFASPAAKKCSNLLCCRLAEQRLMFLNGKEAFCEFLDFDLFILPLNIHAQ